ncbi:MAG: bifunctional DNA-formamidopyrimidine glycosylase/DNA-(apurinic or apyrimidinic site) lyase [Anaerolineales bacterium]|nr:bifunctional DNA-formamidopyrimidine glycosylase/DNA-(apurinic or apyrimidinic site) lyase [Anaerolineales bacterium]
MPELPEVETIARHLRDGNDTPPLPGRRIEGVSLHWPRHIATPSVSTFRRRIRNRSIQDVQRRGKYLVFPLDQGTLLVHLRMSGDLQLVHGKNPLESHDHTIFLLENGWQLRFNDTRKFGRVYLVSNPEEILGSLGPEPLASGFTPKVLEHLLHKRRRLLKPLLIDQSFLAGLGNIYADEALHLAGLHPLRRSDGLDQWEIQALWQGIRTALKKGIRFSGASIDRVYRGGEFQNHFAVYQRAGEPCPVCATAIKRIKVGQRGTHYCPSCQPEVMA